MGVFLWNIGEKIQNEDFKKEALNCINFSASKRSLNDNFIRDAGVCHGAGSNVYF